MTLLLGLVTGTQAVELSVSEQVALVEIRLDGRFVGGSSRPPWIVNCDFGSGLSPHELTATAYDAERRELETIRQWVNLPRDRVEARLALDRSGERAAINARLIWSALDHQTPPSVNLTFDGQPLAAESFEAIPLPPHDVAGLHFLRAELRFSETEQAQAELVFGGTYGDEVATELTGLVMNTEKRAPGLGEMAAWFEKRGRAVPVVAVERGPVNLLIVREKSAATLAGLRRIHERHQQRIVASRQRPVRIPVLDDEDRVRFAFPTIEREQTLVGQGEAPLAMEQVKVSRDIRDFGPLFDILTDAFYPDQDVAVPRQQLADAVAIAGVVAAAGDRRRAVVLIRSGETRDDSRFSPQVVREYLRRLGVPLFVWSIPPEGSETAPPPPSPWGEEQEVLDQRLLNKALVDLRKELRSQVVIWLEGAHLTHEIELTDKARGLRRAG
ncbi:MAG: hypothetical protein GY719_12625 [bacterium]|nr:hypothetical protein [bacterium]